MVDVRMPDGTIIKNVPEGTTRSQLQMRLDRMNPPTGYNETGVSQTLSGTNEGIASALGAPVDLVNSGLKAIGVPTSDNPILGGAWIKDKLSRVGSIGRESSDPGNRFLRRVGQSLGSAAVPIAATAGPTTTALRAFVPALTGGVAAATAKDVAPNNPWAEMGAELAGSLIGGGLNYGSAKRSAARAQAASVPTIPDLKRQAADMYSRAERNGVRASQEQTKDLADQIKAIAQDEGLISPTGRVSEAYPKAKEALQLTRDYAAGEMTPKQMQTVRKVLSEAAGGNDPSEQRIARKMLGAFDDWTAPLAPELAKARGIARRYINADKLETAREMAASKSSQYSGSGFENALRAQYRELDRKIIKGQENGFTPDTIAAIQDVSRGTPMSNAARYIGKLAPTGTVSIGLGGGVPFAVGNAVGGPVTGATLGAGTMIMGAAGRKLATKLGIRQADLAELIARNGGKLPPVALLNPEARRLIVAQLSGQAAPYLNRREVKKGDK